LGNSAVEELADCIAVAGGTMIVKRPSLLVLLLSYLAFAHAQSNPPLRLDKTISMPDVQGRIDHMFFDARSGRLFVAALGNNTVEVIDIRQGNRVRTISGLHEPQGVLYLSGPNRLYVANGEDGTLRIFDGTSYKLVSTVRLGDDADNVRWDDEEHKIYVGYGRGALAAVNEKGTKMGEIPLDAHPESFRLEAHGTRIFVNLPESRKVAVVDKKARSAIATWTTDDAFGNFPMALDMANRRLFVVCRRPARLLALDIDSGHIVGTWSAIGDCDDVFYDPAMKRIYATGGEGRISVFQQQNPDHYNEIASIPTRKGARTSFFSPEAHSLFVAARAQGSDAAAIYVYNVQP
jgi:DNA-binding beta-propeller fold protein YncE